MDARRRRITNVTISIIAAVLFGAIDMLVLTFHATPFILVLSCACTMYFLVICFLMWVLFRK